MSRWIRSRLKKEPTSPSVTITFATLELRRAAAEHARVKGVTLSMYVSNIVRREINSMRAEANPIEDKAKAAILDAIADKSPAELDAMAKRDLQMDKMLDKQLIEIMSKRPEVIDNLDPKVLADLIVRRAPKPINQDEELQVSFLSLKKSLAHLPELPDLDEELRKAQYVVETLQKEVEIEKQSLAALTDVLDAHWPGFWKTFKALLDYVWTAAGEHALLCKVRGPDYDYKNLRVMLTRDVRKNTLMEMAGIFDAVNGTDNKG